MHRKVSLTMLSQDLGFSVKITRAFQAQTFHKTGNCDVYHFVIYTKLDPNLDCSMHPWTVNDVFGGVASWFETAFIGLTMIVQKTMKEL